MLTWARAKPHTDVDPSCGQERASFSFSRGNPRCLGWDKDSRFAPSPGGSASGMDNRGLGLDANESRAVDSCSERRRNSGFKAQAEARQTHPIRAKDPQSARGPLGEVASRVWVESSSVGWPHGGDPFKATLRDNLKSKTGPELDASPGIPSEAGQLFLLASESHRGPEISAGFKKNLRRWGLLRRWSSRTKQALASTLDWVEGGLRGEAVFASPPPVSIASASTFLAGWLPCWEAMG